MLSPVSALRATLVKAYLKIEVPEVPDPIVPLHFNPTEYQLQKANNFAEIAIPGLESPPIQFVRGNSEKLSVDLLVDTSDTLEDVRERYTNKLRALMNIQTELHAPPIVSLVWDSDIFKGVLESLNITYVMFSAEGVPIRAKLSAVMKEYRPVEIQVRESPTASPDFEKSYVVRRGDSLSGIAAVVYQDASKWREIAVANEIQDPRRLEPGRVLNLPRLR